MSNSPSESGDSVAGVVGSEPVSTADALEAVISSSKELADLIQSKGAPRSVIAAPEIVVDVVQYEVEAGKSVTAVQIADRGEEYQQYLQWAAGMDFILMRAVALAQYNLVIPISEALRKRSRQEFLRAKYGSKAALPGTSKHEKGLAIDIDVGSGGRTYFEPTANPVYQFMRIEGHKFGFKVLTDSSGDVVEAWHYEHPGDRLYGNVAGLGLDVKVDSLPEPAKSTVRTAIAAAAQAPASGYVVSYLASTSTAGEQSPITKRQMEILRYGVAVNRAALAQTIQKEGRSLSRLLVAFGSFGDSTTLPFYNPTTGLWSDGRPV